MAYKNNDNKDEDIYKKFLGNINEEPSQSSVQDDEDDPDYNFDSDFRTHLWDYHQSKVPESERSRINDALNDKKFIMILDQQLRQHVQLLTQTYLMTRDTSEYNAAKDMKKHLEKINEVFENKSKPVNLMPALKLTEDYPINSDGKISIRSCWRGIKLPQDIKQAIYSNPNIFLYPSLLPRVAFSTLHRLPDCIVKNKNKNNTSHSIFTDNEKKLFAYALEYEFKEDKKGRLDKISKRLMEAKTSYQLRNHVKNLKRNFDKHKSNNPLEEYLREGKLPTIEHKLEYAVSHYDQPHESYPDWMNEEIRYRTGPMNDIIDIKSNQVKLEMTDDTALYTHGTTPVILQATGHSQSSSSSTGVRNFDSFAAQSQQQFHHPSSSHQHHHLPHHSHHQCTGNDAFLSTAANYEDESRAAIVALTEPNDSDMSSALISENPSRIDGLDLDFGDNATDFMSFLETNTNNSINSNNIDMLFDDGLDCYDNENIEDIVMDTDLAIDEEEEDVEEEDEVEDDDDVEVVVGNEEDIIDDVDDVCKVEDKDYFSPAMGDMDNDVETALCLNEDAMDNCDAYEPMDIGDNAIDLEALMAASTTIAKKQSALLASQGALHGKSANHQGHNTQQLNKRELRAKKLQKSMINLMSQDIIGNGVKQSTAMFHFNHMEDLLKSYYIKQCELCLPTDDYIQFLHLLSDLKDSSCQGNNPPNQSSRSCPKDDPCNKYGAETQKQDMIEKSPTDNMEKQDVVSIYSQILDFFQKINAPIELKDSLVLFLDLEQSIQCGCTINYLYWMKFIQFMKYVELYSDGDETIANKIYRCALGFSKQKAISTDGMSNESTNGNDRPQNCHQQPVVSQPYMGHINTYHTLDSNDRQKLRATMNRALNGHPLLMREFNFLFLDERPHLSYFNCEDDFDDITTVLEKEGAVSNDDYDFEHFKLLVTKEELKYGSSNCQCRCHCLNRLIKPSGPSAVNTNQTSGVDNSESANNNNTLTNQAKISIGRHCGNCNLKFINRKIYLVNQVKPVLAEYTYIQSVDSSLLPDSKPLEKRDFENESSDKLGKMVSKLVGSPHSPTKVAKNSTTSAWTYEEDKALLEYCRSKVLTCEQNEDSVSLNTEMFDELVANQLHGRKSSDQVAKRFNQLVELYKQNATVLDCIQ